MAKESTIEAHPEAPSADRPEPAFRRLGASKPTPGGLGEDDARVDDLGRDQGVAHRGEDAQRLEGLGRLAAGVAHDFNNLLSVILSYSGELATSLADSADRERAEEIRAAAERGAELTGQLLSYSRREPGRGEPVDLNAAVGEATQLLLRTLREDVRLLTQPAPGLPRVLLGPGQAEQILVNLVANARDAMPQGGAVTVQTGLVAVGPDDPRLGTGWHVQLAVSDTGTGMSSDVARRALDRFFTTKDPGRGTGLGLATVREIARGTGGDVRIATESGKGTTVFVYLPAIRSNGDRLALESRADGEGAPPGG